MNRPSHRQHERASDIQTQAEARIVPVGHASGEAVEDRRDPIRRDADPSVADDDVGLHASLRDANVDGPTLAEPNRIGEELVDDPSNRAGVPPSDHGVVTLNAHGAPRSFYRGRHLLDAILCELKKIDALRLNRDRAEVESRHQDQVFDESTYAGDLKRSRRLQRRRCSPGLPPQCIYRELQGREGRSQLVADERQEFVAPADVVFGDQPCGVLLIDPATTCGSRPQRVRRHGRRHHRKEQTQCPADHGESPGAATLASDGFELLHRSRHIVVDDSLELGTEALDVRVKIIQDLERGGVDISCFGPRNDDLGRLIDRTQILLCIAVERFLPGEETQPLICVQ
jgi:hypothetical protein